MISGETMKTFHALDNYLRLQFSDDYWSDEGTSQAHALIRNLTPDGWTALRELWTCRDDTWQSRCAQILPHGEPHLALEVLLDMVHTGVEQVRMAALDSLREMDLDRLRLDQKNSIEAVARDSLTRADKVEGMVLQNLLVELEKSRQRKA